MKLVISIILAAVLTGISCPAFAGGDSVGNGGVLWACRSGLGDREFHAGMLTDLFEAKTQFHLTLIKDPGGNPDDAYQARKIWLVQALPELAEALKSRFQYVEEHLTFVNAELLPTNDYNNVIKPPAAECEGLWKPLNIANFREEDQQVLVSEELWNSPQVATLDKSALLFHEAIYYWMRTYYGSTNSDKSRRIVGILFSTLSPDRMKEEIRRVLGGYPDRPEGRFLCVMKNTERNQIYVAYADNADDAEITVRLRCQGDANPAWCQASTLACDEIVAGPQKRCLAENVKTHRLYQGWGRTQLEAQFNAHMACYVGSQAQGGQAQSCPDFEFMECR